MGTLKNASWDWGERVAAAGLVLFLGATLPLFLFVVGFMLFFDPEVLPAPDASMSESASAALAITAMVTTVCQCLGLALVLWALFVRKVRRRWFYLWMQLASVMMLFSAGSIFLAIIVSRYLYARKDEFRWPLRSTPPPIPSSVEGIQQAPDAAVMPDSAMAGRLDALEAENRRLKAIVAEQAIDIRQLKGAGAERL